MNCRLRGLLLFMCVLVLTFGISVKADPLLYDVQIKEVTQQNNEEVIGANQNSTVEDEFSLNFYEYLYENILDGNSVINIEKKDADIRADIPVQETPKMVSTRDVGGYSSSNLGQNIANYAMSLVGKPYVFGATGPNSFDCSGFVMHVYKKFGINLPRTSQSQAYYGTRISRNELKPGDLIFSNTYSSLSHVGIYVGDGKFVHAANSRTGVTISGVNDSYYGPRYAWSMRAY